MIKNAIFLTCVYPHLTWQHKAIQLYQEYCLNHNIDLIITEQIHQDKHRISAPEPSWLKYGSLYEALEYDYNNIMFADIDILVNPDSDNIFNNFDSGLCIDHHPYNLSMCEYSYIELEQDWPLKEFLVLNNILEGGGDHIRCWGTLFILDRETLHNFLITMTQLRLRPSSYNMEVFKKYGKISHSLIGDIEYDFTDQIGLNCFANMYPEIISKPVWLNKSFRKAKEWTQFLDFCSCDEDRIGEEMDKWLN